MKLAIALITLIVLTLPAAAQQSFRLNDASKNVDVGIDIGVAADEWGSPPATYSFYRKGGKKAFQTVAVDGIDMWDAEPKANVSIGYDDQSVVNFDDFNFDGVEDVALNDGKNGGYGGPSYQIYLYSPAKKLYVLSEPFTELNQDGNLGFMDIDRAKRMIYRSTKDGCCWHQKEGFKVIRGVPVKFYEFTEDVRGESGVYVKLTTRRLVKGKWRKSVRYVKTSKYYKD
jgi:hypothetical protein